ncbi:UNVERIFIED_CONTAM: hypothetical protein HDU68_003998 [Siphonaria sp. JEL0065]|nr:hypothetical protein HDU68_003998 [Siphonaria sp. JEL0065]
MGTDRQRVESPFEQARKASVASSKTQQQNQQKGSSSDHHKKHTRFSASDDEIHPEKRPKTSHGRSETITVDDSEDERSQKKRLLPWNNQPAPAAKSSISIAGISKNVLKLSCVVHIHMSGGNAISVSNANNGPITLSLGSDGIVLNACICGNIKNIQLLGSTVRHYRAPDQGAEFLEVLAPHDIAHVFIFEYSQDGILFINRIGRMRDLSADLVEKYTDIAQNFSVTDKSKVQPSTHASSRITSPKLKGHLIMLDHDFDADERDADLQRALIESTHGQAPPSTRKSNEKAVIELPPLEKSSSKRRNTLTGTIAPTPPTPAPPATSGYTDEVVLIYPSSGPNLVTIHESDLDRLKEGEFLNDTLIEFYIRYTTRTYASDKQSDYHIFNTFFYQTLTTKDEGAKKLVIADTFNKLKRWTRKFDIFKKRFLVLPINERIHWYLAVIWNPGALIAKPDAVKKEVLNVNESESDVSTEPEKVKTAAPALEEEDKLSYSLFGCSDRLYTFMQYLIAEAKDKLNCDIIQDSLVVKYAKVQDQMNYCDCGLFLLHYITTMLRMPDLVASTVIKGEPMNTAQFGTLREIRAMRHFMANKIRFLKASAKK